MPLYTLDGVLASHNRWMGAIKSVDHVLEQCDIGVPTRRIHQVCHFGTCTFAGGVYLERFMNHELPSGQREPALRNLDECYADKPHLRQRLIEISDMIDALVAQGSSAHEAEARAIEQIRRVGKGILTEWAEKSEAAAVAKARAGDPALRSVPEKAPDLALHLRGGECSGATVAAGAARRASAALLSAGSNKCPSLFAAVTAGTDGLRRRPFVCGGEQESARALRGRTAGQQCALLHAGPRQSQRGRETRGSETVRADANHRDGRDDVADRRDPDRTRAGWA